MTPPTLDLQQLALDRTSPSSAARPHRRPWISRYVFPGLILAGFVVMLSLAAGRQLLPATRVTVAPVVVKQTQIQAAGTVLFQAAGWIEPRPSSVRVSALTSGVLDKLLVVEGQDVREGDPVATLISTDARLLLEQAQATLALRKAELQRAIADQSAAQARLENPLHLKAELSDARNALAQTTTELQKLPFLIRSAEAHADYASRNLKDKQSASDSIPALVLNQATRDQLAALAELEELKAREPNLRKEVETLGDRVAALQQQLELLVEERRRCAETSALVESAQAQLSDAQVRLRLAELALERTEIRSPMNGRVLRIVAAPGTRVMGLDELAGQHSATVVELYDPTRLQIRADVRLEDVARVTPGAPVEIETPAVREVLRGRVLLPTSTASVQKNTLEVKVELIEPPDSISPEMLVKASFLASDLQPSDAESPDTPASSTEELILVPQSLITTSEDQSWLWIVDADDRAQQVSVETGGSTPEGLIVIVKGLQITDKLITSDTRVLSDGERVIIEKEDQTLGIAR